MRILGLCGSLRRVSSNAALLEAAARVAPAEIEVVRERAVAELPHFNPDLEGRESPVVLAFRGRLREADAVIVSSPEYAHGVPGALKNALDWVVGSGELSGKPVALFNASPRASLAQAALAEILRTMDARVIDAAAVTLPLLGRNLTAEQIAADAEMAAVLRAALAELQREAGRGR